MPGEWLADEGVDEASGVEQGEAAWQIMAIIKKC